MSFEPLEYLRHVLIEADYLVEQCASLSKEQLLADDTLRRAPTAAVLQVGSRGSPNNRMNRRPALVVSNDLFSGHTTFCIVCPITNTRRDYPFHVSIPEGQDATGFVMVEQVKSIDFLSTPAFFS